MDSDPKPPRRGTAQERRLRLAAALRENLHRRKARARDLARHDPAPKATEPAPGEPACR